MVRIVLYALFWTLFIVNAMGQKLPAPINTEKWELTSAMLADSSILVASGSIEDYSVKRYVFDGTQWNLKPNQLIELLNSIIYKNSHLHFRFSNDVKKLVVMLHGKGDHRIYLTELQENNEWSFFRDIIDASEYSYFNYTPSFSSDNKVLYLSDNGKEPNSFWSYTNTDSFKEKTQYVFDEFTAIDDVIGVGTNSVLFHAVTKKGKVVSWYFLKKDDSGEWTVPYPIKELDNAAFGLTITPFDDVILYCEWSSGDLHLVKTPAIITQELENARKVSSSRMDIATIQKTPKKASEKVKELVKPNGKYFALLIGNSDYQQDKLDLDKPLEDVKELKQVLLDQYSFDEANIITLENANRSAIISALYQLRSLTKDDNLLIFYAGHGFWDKEVEQGYWWPTDAVPDNPANWLSNSDLREQIRGINTAHTLLISDACFSGGIFKSRGGNEIRKASIDVQLLYRMPSRRAMTSGTMSTVPDNSVFFKFLLKYLKENERTFLSANELFAQVRKSVLNNSLTVPQDGVIMDTGDEGGDFIFIRKLMEKD